MIGIDDWSQTDAARFGEGAKRWAAWCAAGRPIVDRADLAIIGDRRIIGAFDEHVWPALPDAIRHHLIATTLIVCGGIDTLGYRTCMPELPSGCTTVVSLTSMSPGVIMHELAHAWHVLPIYAGAPVAKKMAAVAAADEILEHKPPPLPHEDPYEQMADALASELLGEKVNTVSWRRER